MIGFAGIFTWLGRTLTRKFILLLVGFLLLQGAQLFIGVSGNLQLGEEAVFINDAGRQRMRTLLLASMTHQAVTAGSWEPARRQAFDETLGEYETYFGRCLAEFAKRRNPVEKLLDVERRAPVRALLGEAQLAWQQELKPVLLGIDPARPGGAQIALARELLHVVPAMVDPPSAAAAPVAIIAPTSVCPHCGAAMSIAEIFARAQPIRAPPALRVAA